MREKKTVRELLSGCFYTICPVKTKTGVRVENADRVRRRRSKTVILKSVKVT